MKRQPPRHTHRNVSSPGSPLDREYRLSRRAAFLAASSLILALSTTLDFATARAFDPASVPSRPATAIDSMRAEAEKARLSLDWDRADARRQALLARAPGDPFAIREIALEAKDRGLLTPLAEALAGAEKSPIPLPELSKRDHHLLRGYVDFYRRRCRSAAASFDAAIALQEDGWAHFYRARSGIQFPEPRSLWERHLDAALSDQDVWPLLADWILNDDVFEPSTVRHAEERLLEAIRHIPWTADFVDENALTRILIPGDVRPEDIDRMWRAGWATHGIYVANWIPRLEYRIRMCLAPAEALTLYERFEAGAPPGVAERWRVQRALLLYALRWRPTADSLVAHTPLPGAGVLDLRLMTHINFDPPVDLARAARRLAAEALDETADVVWVLDLLGKGEEADSLRQLEEREIPNDQLTARLNRALASGWNRAKPLLDSLDVAGYPPGRLRTYRLRMAEQHGDTLAYQQAVIGTPEEFRDYLGEALVAAYSRGIKEREDRLYRSYWEHSKNDPWSLVWMGRALQGRRDDHLKDLLRRLGEICPGCPFIDDPVVTWYSALGDKGPARQWLRSRAVDPRNGPEDWADLSQKAASVGEQELSDSLFAAAERTAPENRYVRIVAARRRLLAGDLAGANRIVSEILAVVPGDQRALALRDAAVARQRAR